MQTFGICTWNKARKALLYPQLLSSTEYPNQLPNFAQIGMLALYVVMWVWQTKIRSTGLSTRRVKTTAGNFRGLKQSAVLASHRCPVSTPSRDCPAPALVSRRLGWAPGHKHTDVSFSARTASWYFSG